jgi:hypothetical protein
MNGRKTIFKTPFHGKIEVSKEDAMPMEPMTPEQVDALGRMNKKIYDEYRNLGFAGFAVDPIRFLAFRQQTHNDRFSELVVSDTGVFFMDTNRKIKYRFNPSFLLVYHSGLDMTDEEKIRDSSSPIVILDNLLEFWNRHGTGLILVADHLNGCDYLFPEQKIELERVQNLYSLESFKIKPMLDRKFKEQHHSQKGVFDLENIQHP